MLSVYSDQPALGVKYANYLVLCLCKINYLPVCKREKVLDNTKANSRGVGRGDA